MRQIDILDPTPFEGVQIIKASQMAQITRARDVLAEAEAWANNHKTRLSFDLEAARRAAYEQAYVEGLALFTEAIVRYDQETKALAERVMSIVRLCLSRILTNQPSDVVLHDLMMPVLREARAEQDLMILVHPDRLQDLKAAIAMSSTQLLDGVELTPHADATIGPEDCLIYTQDEVFRVSIPLTCDILCGVLSKTIGAEASDVS